jgi:anionic cell wall polymer biosynthesis LytR-Cps2A-Psr (LCP) family protein
MPQRWAVIHLDRFTELIDTLGGVTIDIPKEDHPLCGGLPTGETVLDGPHMLCYARSRQGLAEYERNRRQQEVLWAVFQHLTHGGNLARLPELFNLFGEAGVTNLNLTELTAYIPLALQMSEHDQFAFYSFSSQHMDAWQMPGMARSSVFLPRSDAAAELVQQAANFVLTPAPGSSAKMATLVYELTTSPTPTTTTVPSATPRNTPTPTETELPTETPTPTVTLTPTVTVTETPTLEVGTGG